MRKVLSLLGIALCCVSSRSAANDYLNRCNLKLLDVIMEDIFSPPVASRIQVYSNIAAYEVLCQKYPSLRSLSGQISHLQPIPKPSKKIDYSIAAECAFVGVAKKLVYSEYILDSFLNAEKNTGPRIRPLFKNPWPMRKTSPSICLNGSKRTITSKPELCSVMCSMIVWVPGNRPLRNITMPSSPIGP